MLKTVFQGWLGVLCIVSSAQAIEPGDVPEPLKPWVNWALHDAKQAGCPFLYSDADHRHCAWGSALTLDLGEAGGSFSQHWQVQRASWIELPGDARQWPQSVKLDGQAVAVVEREGHPAVRVDAGNHQLTGGFAWPHLPEALALANNTGLVTLTLKHQPVAAPYIDEQGRVWLQRKAADVAAEDTLDVRVHRLLDDDIPLTLTTRLQLSVSGKGRELVLPPLLLEGFIPLSMQSPLPARLEADGKLRLQARPGTWEITLVARHTGPVQALPLPAGKEPLTQEEVWAFNAHNALRLVNVEGVPALDPQQTTLPPEWKQFPAYRIRPGDTFKLVEKKRGDPEPAPDQLNLQRTLWLDFDGGGYTVRDQISGAINRSWRLDMASPAQLGRVAVDGQDQLITQGRDKLFGVELRQGRANIVAESRLPRQGVSMAAVGWQQDYQGASSELRLPPGWKLFAATGVDEAPGTWLQSWNLLDIFLVLVVAFASGKLWGRRWGVIALVTMALVYPETGAPQWVWLSLLAAVALIRYLPTGSFLQVVKVCRGVAFVALLLIALPFAVQQIRVGIYPALEKPWGSVGAQAVPEARIIPAAAPAAVEDAAVAEMPEMLDKAAEAPAGSPSVTSSMGVSRPQRLARETPAKAINLAEHDPNARIQTGPGLPEWSWNSYRLAWSGLVRHDQRMQLWLLSPAMNLLLAFVRVGLIVVLAWRVLDLPLPRRPRFTPQAGAMAMAAILAGVASPVDRAWADLPSTEMLEELQSRLVEPPECLPQCASSPRLLVEVRGDSVRLRQEIHTLADTAVPLPGSRKHWMPKRIVVDGEAQPGLLYQGEQLWLRLPKGSHQVVLEGVLSRDEGIEIPLPLHPYAVESSVEGWELEGVHDDGQADDSLRFKRIARAADKAGRQNIETLPPFVRIERFIRLGLKWQIETRVTRLSPAGSAIALEVPLLPGESVLSEWVRTKDGRAQISMAPTAVDTAWTSDLKEAPQIALQATAQNQWAETWRIDASPIWHIEFAGIPPVGHLEEGRRLPTYRPWPGEALNVTVTRPAPVAGQTLTIDSSQLAVRPGIRDSDATLDVRLRSSQGGQHAISLPAGAELLAVRINGQEQPIRAQNGKVVLPVVPGAQTVSLTFREPHGMGLYATTPAVDIGVASVNSRISVEAPQDRWSLFLGGPRLGPAVLFWGVLIVLVAVAWGLGKVPLAPLKSYEWLLLGLGLTQTPPAVALLIAGWLLALGWRGREGENWSKNSFNFVQLLLGLWTLVALSSLFFAIQHGLLGLPEMQIEGNGSSAYSLQWFQDRSDATLPQAWIVSVPLWVYRFLMLAWALWLAAALMRWLRWGWGCYVSGGIWRKLVLSEAKPGAKGKNSDESHAGHH